ncbi:ketose-bisphosphate aldolase [candidate division KSB1 bacterium]|nr:ketose-bisphosphate aldolase [candidate division KSB1 bacterium]
MPLVTMKSVLDRAYKHGYAVGAFNVVNIEFLEAIIETAEERQSPVILSIGEAHFPYIKLENICPAIHAMAAQSPVPIALNLDHGGSFEVIIRAIRNGFTGVMYDGSKLRFEENVANTREIVKLCRPVGVTVEAELGAVGGDEGGGLMSKIDTSLFTDPHQAADFVRLTAIDALAVAIGNAHGKYKGEPMLDFDRLETIRKAVNIPLVLHGGSGISSKDFKQAIGRGIAKINIFTGMSQSALSAAQKFLNTGVEKYHAYPQLMRSIKDAVKKTVSEQIEIFGSSGEAGHQF